MKKHIVCKILPSCPIWPIPVLASLVLLPLPVWGQPREALRVEASAFLRACNTGSGEARRRCETNRQVFVEAYIRARRGDYQGQRAVARLLAAAPGTESATTPFSAVIANPIEACAWRTIIINGDQADANDEARERRDCSRLTESEHLAADLRASELLALIGHAPVRDPTSPNCGEGS